MTDASDNQKVKEDLLKALRDGNLEGIDSLLDKIDPGNALYISHVKDLDPKIVDKFYDIFKEHYDRKDGYSHVVRLCEAFQKKHREKYQLNLNSASSS